MVDAPSGTALRLRELVSARATREREHQHTEREERDRLLRELLGEVGEGVVVKPPFRCDYGLHVAIGTTSTAWPAEFRQDRQGLFPDIDFDQVDIADPQELSPDSVLECVDRVKPEIVLLDVNLGAGIAAGVALAR